MQHVHSHYAEKQSHGSSVKQTVTATVQCVVPDKAWLSQLTTPAFMPLVTLSPESSSSSSVGQEPMRPNDCYVT